MIQYIYPLGFHAINCGMQSVHDRKAAPFFSSPSRMNQRWGYKWDTPRDPWLIALPQASPRGAIDRPVPGVQTISGTYRLRGRYNAIAAKSSRVYGDYYGQRASVKCKNELSLSICVQMLSTRMLYEFHTGNPTTENLPVSQN
jgi:hypothetical protein